MGKNNVLTDLGLKHAAAVEIVHLNKKLNSGAMVVVMIVGGFFCLVDGLFGSLAILAGILTCSINQKYYDKLTNTKT